MNPMQIILNNSRSGFDKIGGSRRITFGDLQRLRREIGPDGIESREEAERLIVLERGHGRLDHGFADWLVAAMVDFVVWSGRPTGTVTEDDARWLAAILTDGRGRPAGETASRILRGIATEAQVFENDALAILATAARTAPARRAHAAVLAA